MEGKDIVCVNQKHISIYIDGKNTHTIYLPYAKTITQDTQETKVYRIKPKTYKYKITQFYNAYYLIQRKFIIECRIHNDTYMLMYLLLDLENINNLIHIDKFDEYTLHTVHPANIGHIFLMKNHVLTRAIISNNEWIFENIFDNVYNFYVPANIDYDIKDIIYNNFNNMPSLVVPGTLQIKDNVITNDYVNITYINSNTILTHGYLYNKDSSIKIYNRVNNEFKLDKVIAVTDLHPKAANIISLKLAVTDGVTKLYIVMQEFAMIFYLIIIDLENDETITYNITNESKSVAPYVIPDDNGFIVSDFGHKVYINEDIKHTLLDFRYAAVCNYRKYNNLYKLAASYIPLNRHLQNIVFQYCI